MPDRWSHVTHVLDAATGKKLGAIARDGQVTIDARHNRLYLTDQGVYLVDAASLRVTGAISETLRASQMVVPGALSTQYDEVHDLLFVTMTNNSPGSSSSTWLQIYDGTSQARISSTIKTSQQFVGGLALAPAADRVWVSSSFPKKDLAAFTSAGQVVARLQGVGGQLFSDPARRRLYAADWGGVVTIDTAGNSVIAFRPLSVLSPGIMVYDPQHRRLYVSATSSAEVLAVDPEQAAAVVAQEAAALPPVAGGAVGRGRQRNSLRCGLERGTKECRHLPCRRRPVAACRGQPAGPHAPAHRSRSRCPGRLSSPSLPTQATATACSAPQTAAAPGRRLRRVSRITASRTWPSRPTSAATAQPS